MSVSALSFGKQDKKTLNLALSFSECNKRTILASALSFGKRNERTASKKALPSSLPLNLRLAMLLVPALVVQTAPTPVTAQNLQSDMHLEFQLILTVALAVLIARAIVRKR